MPLKTSKQMKVILSVLVPALCAVTAGADSKLSAADSTTSWDIMVLDSQTAYYEAVTNNITAQIEASEARSELANSRTVETESDEEFVIRLEALGFKRGFADPASPAKPAAVIEAVVPPKTKKKSRRKVVSNFTWVPSFIGKSTEGTSYAEFERGDQVRRVLNGGSLEGWSVTISDGGSLTVSNGNRKIAF